jgi:hypothetical protein
MAQTNQPRRGSLVLPILLIAIGAIFLYANWHPAFDPWPILWTYWPLILIFIGLGKIYDSWRRRQNPDAPPGPGIGTTLGVVIFILVILALFSSGRRWSRWRGGTVYAMQHFSRSVDRQAAKTVNASIEMGAGELNISGGSSHLLEADFDYRSNTAAPKVDYNVSGTTGDLNITQEDSNPHIGTTSDNHWTLHFANDIPLDINIDMGAGHGNLRLRDIDVTHLKLDMGAGQVDLDLTGVRKSDLTGTIEGGVGEANIRLPKNIGVVVTASGGIGTIDVHGLKQDGDDYTNDLYGKSPVTIRLTVEGGIGRISLTQEP